MLHCTLEYPSSIFVDTLALCARSPIINILRSSGNGRTLALRIQSFCSFEMKPNSCLCSRNACKVIGALPGPSIPSAFHPLHESEISSPCRWLQRLFASLFHEVSEYPDWMPSSTFEFRIVRLPQQVSSVAALLSQGLSRKKKTKQSMKPMLLIQTAAPKRKAHNGCCAYLSLYIVQWFTKGRIHISV
jgi:hypothetical protein